MKIVEIKEPKHGMVFKSKVGDLMLYCKARLSGVEDYEFTSIDDKWKDDLAGAIGITHEINDGKLIEIPRKEIEVGDVFHSGKGDAFCCIIYISEDESYDVIASRDNKCICISDEKKPPHGDDVKKVGIMGITHEIDWRNK